jgi:WD40 repeat protein
MNFYDTQTLEEIEGEPKKIENYSNINCQQFDLNKLVFGDADGFLSVYNLNTGKRIWRALSHKGGLESLEFTKDNNLVCSGWTKNVSCWDLEVEERTLEIVNCHTEPLCVTKYVKNQEDFIITTSYDKTIKLFDLRSSKCTATIDFSKSGIPSCLDFSVDGNSFAVGSSTGGISIFDMREIGDCYSNILLNINSHRSTVTCLFYDGYRLISGGYDHKVIGWDTELNERNFTIKPGNKVLCMHFDGTRIGVGLEGKKLGWYDLSKSPVRQFTSMRAVYAARI